LIGDRDVIQNLPGSQRNRFDLARDIGERWAGSQNQVSRMSRVQLVRPSRRSAARRRSASSHGSSNGSISRSRRSSKIIENVDWKAARAMKDFYRDLPPMAGLPVSRAGSNSLGLQFSGID
jgi:hypothetical protein